MLAYQMLWEEEQGLSLNDVDVKNTSCPVNVEKILNKFNTHRCAIDFDSAILQGNLHEKRMMKWKYVSFSVTLVNNFT